MIEVRLTLHDAMEINLVAQLQQVLEQKRNQEYRAALNQVDTGAPATVTEPVLPNNNTAPVMTSGNIAPAATPAVDDLTIQRAITDFAHTHGAAKAREVLGEFGVQRVSLVPEERRGAFVTRLAEVGAGAPIVVSPNAD